MAVLPRSHRGVYGHSRRRAFALPTVLIASIVMLSVLLVAVSSTTATRTALLDQYYEQLAHAAGDAGVAYATACLNANNGIPQWSNAHPLTPSTDCTGTSLSGVTCPDGVTTFFSVSTPSICSVTYNYANSIRSSFSLGLPQVSDASILVVGGGGGGAGAGSGGGAGGYVYTPSFSFSTGSYPVTVGGAGAGGTGHGIAGSAGGNSVFSTITAQGGGYGIPLGDGAYTGGINGANGGSGGGGAITTAAPTAIGGLGPQGNAGGAGYVNSGWTGDSGGGGGAGGAGVAGGNTSGAGNGGAGLANSITGTSLYYAAGGGAGEINGSYVGTGGSSIGGSGVINAAGTNGTTNTGSGGGGGSYNTTYYNGGNGGSGIVIIKYPTGLITATGGTTTTSGGYTIQTFTSSGTFTVTSVASAVKTLPNTGYVQLLRQSTGAVWRTYNQQATQEAVPPALCSGAATSTYGWSNVATSAAVGGSAYEISISSNPVTPGPVYYRKDFNVLHAGTYTLQTYSDSSVNWYIDSSSVGSGSSTSQSVTLSGGCHTIYAVSNNSGITPSNEFITAALTASGATIPLVVTDGSWRASAGNTYHYSTPNFYTDATSWTVARDYNAATAIYTSWATVSGDSTARSISTTYGYDGSNNYPSYSYADFTDGRNVTVATPTPVKVSYGCDDSCTIYLDGNAIASGNATTESTTLTLTEGTHRFGVSEYNITGAGDIGLVVVQTSNSAVLTRTDASWLATTSWNQVDPNPYSYDAYFQPYPAIPSVAAQVLVVGGGASGGTSTTSSGGGGGGGAGGLSYSSSYNLLPGQYSVVVGAGGASVATASTNGNNGGNSSFGSITVLGGGGGGKSPAGLGNIGGSGGGAGYNAYATVIGTIGIIGQGNSGGNVLANNNGGGGGGAGGVGGNTNSTGGSAGGSGGLGGAGGSYSISGSPVTYAKGGEGGTPPSGAYSGTTGSGNGGSGIYGTASTSGAGGSGVVVISYPTTSMTTDAANRTGETVTTSGSNTIVTFTASGTFTIISIP